MDRIEKLCAERGMRMTEQRRVIARVLGESHDHPDVEELYRRASAIDPHISIATVYRTVRLFEEAGVVEDEAELLTIAVDPKWRGKRIGQALLKAVFDDLLLTPARRMLLEVSEENVAAIKLYQREGFATISSRKGYYPKPDGSQATALVMARDLG